MVTNSAGRSERRKLSLLRRPHLWVAVAALAFVAGIGGALYWAPSQHQDAAGGVPFARTTKPKAIPELQFRDASGRERSLADFRGRMVLLNIWATWCTPCREEMPALDRLQAKLGGPEFEVLALSVDQQGAEPVRKFYDDIGIRALERYIDPSAQAAFKLGAVGLPATLLVDRGGREIGRHVGPAKWDAPEVVEDLRRRIEDGRRQ
jgi:thiol-disulfide isomerase/thioredoxin